MYADPKLIKKHRVVIYIDEYDNEDLQREVETTGGERSVIARERYLRGVKSNHAQQSAQHPANMRAPHSGLVCA
jgi:hypothetical protein